MEDLTQYRDPATTLLENGRTVAESIRPGKGGLVGAIVRRSDQFGVPLGQKPNEVAPKVIIDPDTPGAGFVVDMAKMGKQEVEQAVNNLRVTPDMDDASRAAAIMRAFAVPQEAAGNESQMNQPIQQQTGQPAAPTMATQPPQQPNQQSVSLFAQIGNGQQKQTEPPTREDIVPRFRASFQSRNAPCTQDGFFHRIIRQGANLIFVYDRRAIGYPRTWPQAVDEDVAVHLEGANVIYITQTTGIEFTDNETDYCILLIKEEHPYQPPS